MQCPKCESEQDNESAHCSSCGANLLPGRPLLVRLLWLVVSAGALAVLVLVPYLAGGRIPFFGLVLLFPSGISVFVFALRMAIGAVSDAERYRIRASRFKANDPEQAVRDYTRAILFGDRKEGKSWVRAVVYDRAQVLKAANRKEEAVEDLKDYIRQMWQAGKGKTVRVSMAQAEVIALEEELGARVGECTDSDVGKVDEGSP